MDHHSLYAVVLLLIIKNCEVNGYWSSQVDFQPQTSEFTASSVIHPLDHFFDPDLFEHRHLPVTSVHPPTFKNPAPTPILIDTSKDDDDDWLSLLHFLIIALKNKKHGYNPYKDGEISRRFEGLTDCDNGSKGKRKENSQDNNRQNSNNLNIPNKNENCNGHGTSSDSNSGCSCALCQLAKNNLNNGCGCVFIPYPIAVPINVPNGLGNDLCSTHLEEPCNETNTTPQTCNCCCKELNEINVIIRTE